VHLFLVVLVGYHSVGLIDLLAINLLSLLLVSHADKIVTHRQLLQEVWGPDAGEESRYLRVYVGNIRRNIEGDPSRPEILVTESGVGYKVRTLPPGRRDRRAGSGNRTGDAGRPAPGGGRRGGGRGGALRS
jgi:hypothetical protein